MHIDMVELDSSQRPLLRVVGSAGTNYVLEQSQNVSDWYSLYSGVATNGTLEYRDAMVSGPAAFYRARVAGPPLKVQSKLDTNRFGVGLVSSSGGYCEVTAVNGTRFKLTVSSNSLSDSVVVRMTVITNLAGVPGGGLFPAAVQLEPDGLQFMGAGLLEIEFPTNIPMSEIASYGFGKDGTDFHLTPDSVETNKVRIPVSHFSSAGTTRVNKQELANLISLPVQNALNQMDQTVASKIDIARQNGTATVEMAQNAFAAEASRFLQDHVLPHLQEATRNCALFKQIMPQVWGLDRQAQLLGAGTSIPELAAAESIFCSGILNCEQEIVQQCAANGGDTGLLSELIDTERARALMGGSACPPPPDLWGGMTNCMPLWTGELSYTLSGSGNESGDPHCTQNYNVNFRFSGIVTNATEQDLIAMKLITLYLQGDGSGERVIDRTCSNGGLCSPTGSWSSYDHSRQSEAAAGKQSAVVSWYRYPDGTVMAFAIDFGAGCATSGSVAMQNKYSDCDSSQDSLDTITSLTDTLAPYSYSDYTGAGVTATSASGMATQTFPEPQGPVATATWTWSFHRK